MDKEVANLLMSSYMKAQNDAYSLSGNAAYILNRSIVVYKQASNFVVAGNKEEAIKCIMDNIIYMYNVIKEHCNIKARAVEDLNNFLYVTHKNLPSFFDVEFPLEHNDETSIARSFGKSAECFAYVLTLLAGYKKILKEYCGKAGLASSVDKLYAYINNNLIPNYKEMEIACNKFFIPYEQSRDSHITLKSQTLSYPSMPVKSYDIEHDKFGYSK